MSISNAAVAAVKRAAVLTAAKHGITEYHDIVEVCQAAVEGIGPQTLPAYKAWKTMDKEAKIACKTCPIVCRRR